MDAPRRSPDDPRDLLAAYRDGERMPAAARAAAWRDLQAELHAPPSTIPLRRRRSPALLGAAVLLAAAVLLFVVRPAALAPTTTAVDPQAAHDAIPPPPTPTITTPARPAADPDRSVELATPAIAHEPAQSSEPRPIDPPRIPRIEAPPRIPPPDPRITAPRTEDPPHIDPPQLPALERELALLRAARDALARDDAAAALTILAEHAAEFPAGHLREERLVLRVEALCAAGSRADARREATSFAQAHPDSPHARTLQRVCP